MTKLEQAARQALGALEVAITPLAEDRQEVLRAITALREALSGVQEPALFVSAKQLADLVDPSHATGGSYLPARKTRAGLFTQPLYTAPQPSPSPLSVQDEDAAMYRWLRAQHEDDSGELRCCVYAPNDMLECLVPVGDMPGELDAFIRAALAAQGGKDA